MSDLVRREGEETPDRPRGAGRPVVAASASVDSGIWEGTVPDFPDLGARRPHVPGRELHGAVVDEGLVRRRRTSRGDRYYRRRMGWVATTGGIAVVHAEQALAPDPQGRMRPRAPFVARRTTHLELTAPPKRRVGEVPDVAARTTGGGGEGGSPAPARPKGYWRDSPFAPTTVREGIASFVSSPDLQVASAVSWDDGKRHSVSLLAMDGRRAVAVECSRLSGASHWQVEQLTYELRPDVEPVGGGPQRERIGG